MKSKALSQDFFCCNYFEAGTSKGFFYNLGLNSSALRNSLSWGQRDRNLCIINVNTDHKNLRIGLISVYVSSVVQNIVFIVRLSPFSFVLHLQNSQWLQVQTEQKTLQELKTTNLPCGRSGSAAGREGWGSPAEALMGPQQVVAPGGSVL